MKLTRLRRIASVLSLAALFGVYGLTGPTLSAQSTTADILGTVTDSSGAVVPGATVTVRNLGTGQIRTMATESTGDYVFTALQIGNYSVSVTAPSFKSFSVSSIVISAGDRARVNAQLVPGAATESVVVEGIAPALQTDSSASGDMLGEKSVQDLPLNGRNYVNLIQITAGVNAGQPSSLQSGNRNSDRRQTGAFSANGQSDVFNNNMIDGLDNNAGSFIGVKPSVDGIQEIKILTNNYTAEVGRAAGAVVNVVTKSGTNEFHGSAYEYLRNDIFDARYYFAGTGRKPELRFNQFGGSFGGPIFKNKTFFFGDAEGYRSIKALTSLYTVPTEYEMAHPGDMSDRCNPATVAGCVIPTANINSIGLNFFNLFPKTGQTGGFTNNYQGTVKDQQNLTTVDARIDHSFGANDALFLRYAYNPVSTVDPGPFPAVNGVQSGGSLNGLSGYNNNTTQNAQADYTHIFKPTLLMQVKAGYTRYQQSSSPLNFGKNYAQTFGMVNVNLPNVPGTSGLTNVLPIGYTNLGDTAFMPGGSLWNTYQANGAVTYIRGAHTIKMGSALIRRENSSLSNQFPVGLMAFSALSIPFLGANYPYSLSALLAGAPSAVLRGNQIVPLIFEYWEPSAYVQDDWHAAHNLTLNLGVRYEIFPPNTEKRHRNSNFNLSTLTMDVASAGNKTLGVKTGYGDFSPRVGFALELPRQTAVHGGFGMSHYTMDIMTQIGSGNVPSVFSNQVNFPTASIKTMVVPTAPDPTTIASNKFVTGVSSWPKTPQNFYVEQFSLEVQKQFGANVATLGYVGELGRKLWWQYNADEPLPPGAGATTVPNYIYQTQYPYLTTITVYNNAASMSYHALRAQMQRRTAKGLTVNGNYTYARGLTDSFSSSSYNGTSGVLGGLLPNPRYDYGNSDFDVRHRFAATIAYEIPIGKSFTGAKGAALKGWQVNTLAYWQTGLPFTVTNSAPVSAKNSAGTTLSVTQDLLPAGAGIDRPNMIHSAHLSNTSIKGYFDTTAFQLQALGTAGNEHRNQTYGPHDRRMDLSLFKTFPIYEKVSLQFRAECFNIFNIANFSTPNNQITAWTPSGAPDTTNTSFGTISSTSNAEVPRQIQFALKATF